MTDTKRSQPKRKELVEAETTGSGDRRLYLGVTKRKRIPAGTLLAVEEEDGINTIIEFGWPTKKGTLQTFQILGSGVATKGPVVSESAFLDAHQLVVRTATPTTLDIDKSIHASRLNFKTVTVKSTPPSTKKRIVGEEEPPMVKEDKEKTKGKEDAPIEEELDLTRTPAEKRKREEEEEEPTKKRETEKEKEEEGEEPTKKRETEKEKEEEAAIVLDPSLLPEEVPDQDSPNAKPVSETKLKDDVAETIKVLADEDGQQPVPPPSAPEPVDPSRFTGRSIQEQRVQRLLDSAQKEEDVDKSDQLFARAQELADDLKRYDQLPATVEKVEEENIQTIENEMDTVQSNTVEQLEGVQEAEESPEARLATENIVAPVTKDVRTGGSASMDIVETLEKDATDPVDSMVVDEKHRKDIPLVTEMDDHNPDKNRSVRQQMLGTEQMENGDIDMLDAQHSSIATSANAQAERVRETEPAPMDIIPPTPEEIEIKKIQNELDQLDALMDLSPTAEEVVVEKRKRLHEQLSKLKKPTSRLESDPRNIEDVTETKARKEAEEAAKLASIGKDVPDFRQLSEQLRGLPSPFGPGGKVQPFDAQNPIHNTKLYELLRKQNKIMDVRTADAPTTKELFEQSVEQVTGDLKTPDEIGTSGLGTPVFVPAASRNELYTIYSGMTITDAEAKEMRDEMVPLWNEFKVGRLNAGVRQMEAMPTRLLRSDQSNIKNMQKFRQDLKQQDETFGYFMFWLLHDKMNTSRLQTWRYFLGFAAAMGYNNLTQADINWMITGSANGDLQSTTNFHAIDNDTPLDTFLDIMGKNLTQETVNRLHAQVVGNPEPQAEYPSRNTSPSAAPVDNSIHPDGSSSDDRRNQRTFAGLPTNVMNIPDPRFSKRGGSDVPNIRIVTRRNPKYIPSEQMKLKPDDPKRVPEFITEEVPDIGAGSKDVGQMIEAAESDRLLSSIPSRLYAPIHSQACDRYLGAKNYQRLSLPLERYMKSYSRHAWGPTDFQEMFQWNTYTMALYGSTLYAFVTDIQMQRTTPVFDLSTPEGVGDEYMELNELITELANFQQKADDRGTRVHDSSASRNSIESHLSKFYDSRDAATKQRLAEGNALIISTADQPPLPSSIPSGSDPITPITPSPILPPSPGDANPWGPGPDPRIDTNKAWEFPGNDHRLDPSKPLDPSNPFDPNDTLKPHTPPPAGGGSTMFQSMKQTNMTSHPIHIGAKEMDTGVRKLPSSSVTPIPIQNINSVVDKRNRMFQMFHGR